MISLRTRQTTVKADTNSCENCAETSRSQQWGPDLPFFGGKQAMQTRWMLAQLLIKAGDGNTYPGPTTLHQRVLICDICYKHILVRKPSTQIIQSHISHRHNTTPPTRPLSNSPTLSPHTPHTPRNPNTDTRPTFPLFSQDW